VPARVPLKIRHRVNADRNEHELDDRSAMIEDLRSMAAARKRSRGRPRKRETKLSRWIDSSGMTRDEVAEKLGINRTHLDMICRAESRPGLALAFEIERLTRGELPASEWVSAPVHRG
jgi:DNA-binding XRE family transcriptional regulator